MKPFKHILSVLFLSIAALLVMTTVINSGCDRGRAEENAQALQAQQDKARQDAKPRHLTMVIPSGTSVVASLNTLISTETNHSGDSFQASTVDAIVVDGRTRHSGRLEDSRNSSRRSGLRTRQGPRPDDARIQ